MSVSNLIPSPSIQYGASRSKRRNTDANQNKYLARSRNFSQDINPQNIIADCFDAIEKARSSKHATQKLFQAVKAITALSEALNSQILSDNQNRHVEFLNSIVAYGQSLQKIVENAKISQTKPRQMESFEVTVLIHLIFDLVHPEKNIAQSAQDNLLKLKLPLERIDLLRTKILETIKPKNSLQFSAQSLQELVQDSLETIRQRNSVFEVMDKVATHYLQMAESTIPLVLFGAANLEFGYDVSQKPSWATWESDNDVINRYNSLEWNQHLTNRKFQLAEMERNTLQQNILSLKEANATLAQTISKAVSDGVAQGIAQSRVFSQFQR